MSKRLFGYLSLILTFMLVLSACGGGNQAAQPQAQPTSAPVEAPTAAPAEPTAVPTAEPAAEAEAEPTAVPEPTLPPTNTPVALNTFDEKAADGRTVVKWYVGLGTGGNPQQIEVERAVVEAFNESQDEIYLSLQIVDNTVAYTTLATQIGAGDIPDIIGPVGTAGRNGFSGQFLDLTDLIASHNVDLSQYEPALVESYNLEGQGQIGLPFAVYPSFIFYNKDLFDEADLPYPPQKYGEEYDGKPWNYDTLRDIAQYLTVDANGNDATSPDFDPTNIVQFGYETQWGTDPRAWGTQFGASNIVGADGKASISPNWEKAFQYFYDAMWKDYFMPNEAYRSSDQFGSGNVFNSGKLAMAYTHLWYSGSIQPPSAGGVVENWDLAVVPSFEGETTAKLHADTFVISKHTKNPDAAFTAYMYLLQSKELLQAYGAFPAIKSYQEEFFEDLNTKFAPITPNWQVAVDSLAYPDNPNHEEDMPNFLKARQAITDFGTLLRSSANVDVPAETAKLKEQLDVIFAETP